MLLKANKLKISDSAQNVRFYGTCMLLHALTKYIYEHALIRIDDSTS
jgi:hypothetical protein